MALLGWVGAAFSLSLAAWSAGHGSAQASRAGENAPMNPSVKIMQGVVKDVVGSTAVLSFPADRTPNGRQVDLSSALYEDTLGQTIQKFQPAVGDWVVVAVDPTAPTLYRPPAVGNGVARPTYVRLLPLKILAIAELHSQPGAAQK